MVLTLQMNEQLARSGMRPALPRVAANAFLGRLPDEDREAVVSAAAAIRLLPGESLWEAGDTVAEVFFPISGVLAELVQHRDARTALARLAGSDTALGDLSGVGRPAIGPVVALTRCEGLHIDGKTFARLTRERPSLREALNGLWAQMAEDIAITAGCAACHKLERRLPSLLMACASHMADGRVELTHDQMCQLLGAQRTTVTSLMRALKDEGAIRTGRGWSKVVDEAQLARRSCGCGVYGARACTAD